MLMIPMNGLCSFLLANTPRKVVLRMLLSQDSFSSLARGHGYIVADV
jgi:hypothetical protein